MREILAIASSIIRDAVRRKVVWAVVLFAGALAFVAPSLPSYGIGVVGAVYREVTFALMYVAAALVGLTLAATRIPQEVERRTVFTVLTRDISRARYVSGVWLGVTAVTAFTVLAFTVVAILVGYFEYGEWMFILFESSLAVLFEVGVASAVAILASTRFGSITSVVAAVVFIFLGHNITTVVEGPWIPSLAAFDVVTPVAHGSGYTLVYGATMAGIFACWVAALLVLASYAFQGRDL